MPRFKKLASLATKTIIILLLTFVLAEITFRVYHYFNPTFILYDRSYRRFRGKPGAPVYDFHLNSRGFKDVEFKQKKEANTYRVVALGDSFAFGVVPYEHNYLTLLEQQLNGSDRQVEVLNMGISGIGPQHYLALLENEGIQLRPNMVLVSFFIGNDFMDTMLRRRTKIHDYSAVVALIKYCIDIKRRHERIGPSVYDDNAPTFIEKDYVSLEKMRSPIYSKREPLKQAFADTIGYLVQIKELCDRNEIALMVVVLPDELQVDPVLQTKVLEALNASPDELDFTLPNRFLSEQFQVHRIDYCDLLDEFSSASAEIKLYKPYDSHWSIAGNKLAADVLARSISSQLGR